VVAPLGRVGWGLVVSRRALSGELQVEYGGRWGPKQQRRVPEPLCERMIVGMQRRDVRGAVCVCVSGASSLVVVVIMCRSKKQDNTCKPSVADLLRKKRNAFAHGHASLVPPPAINTAMPLCQGGGRVPREGSEMLVLF